MALKQPRLTTLCGKSGKREMIERYAKELRDAAPTIGSHGMSPDEFWQSGLFEGAIERLRGSHAATMTIKKEFIAIVLQNLKEKGHVTDWSFKGSGERHDYEVTLIDNTNVVIEAKGCLDGNNTNIFERPLNADEFYIWSLCQNPGSDPEHNAWSGIHTRLGAEIIHRRQKVDALIVWDMLCGSNSRPCPKQEKRNTEIEGQKIPPPCIYLFPKTIPDPRNNPSPPLQVINNLRFATLLLQSFNGDISEDLTQVRIDARMNEANVERKTTLIRNGKDVCTSKWTKLKRAR